MRIRHVVIVVLLVVCGLLLFSRSGSQPRPADPAHTERPPLAATDVALAADAPKPSDHAASNPTATSPPAVLPASVPSPAAEGTGCIEYDVLMRCADGIDLLDVPRTLQSLQLNPRCIPLAAEATAGVRAELKRLVESARQTLGRRYAGQAREMRMLIDAGRLPKLDASLHPEIYQRTLRQVERAWQSLHPTLVEQPDWRDQPDFRLELRNRLANAFFEHTDYKVTTIVNCEACYAARYQDLPGFCTAMLDGEYEALATEGWAALVAFFHAQNALTDAERDALWDRFAVAIGEYAQQAAAIYR